jgi:hypothetical protein
MLLPVVAIPCLPFAPTSKIETAIQTRRDESGIPPSPRAVFETRGYGSGIPPRAVLEARFPGDGQGTNPHKRGDSQGGP